MIGANAIKTSINEPKEEKSLLGNMDYDSLSHHSTWSLTSATLSGANPFLWQRIKMTMVILGPTEAIPTRPKLSFVEFLPPLTVATPAPKERINGTVADPVVMPPLSKINGKNALLFASGEIHTKQINKNVMK